MALRVRSSSKSRFGEFSVLVTARLRFASSFCRFRLFVWSRHANVNVSACSSALSAPPVFSRGALSGWNNQLTDIKTSVALGALKRPLMSRIMTTQQTRSCSNQRPSGGERDAPDGGGGLIEPNRLDCESLACTRVTMER